jgi:amino acid adenylation domain-containing protein
MLAYPRGPGMDVQLCVEGDGAIDPPALAAAVATASQACPGARLVRRGRRWVDSGRAPAVRVADPADLDRTRPDSRLMRTPLAGRRAGCEVVLVPGTPATVVFRAHHAVMDRGGALLWQRQVFRALRGEAVEGAASRRPREARPEHAWPSGLGRSPRGPRRAGWRRRTIEGTHPAVTAKIARLVAASGEIASIAHLGAVDLADFCAGGFEATALYSLGGIDFTPQIDIVESQGRTEITVAWSGGDGAGERAEALLDWIADGLTPAAYRTWDGNRTGREAPPATLTALFAEQVAKTPEAVAVSGTDGELTYAQLDQRAAAIAALLRGRGIGRGDRVGLVTGRSAAAIAGIWGILKAGAAYLPIDESYPDARITRLLTDAGARACLLEPPVGARGVLPAGCPGIALDRSRPLHGPAAPWRDAAAAPEDLACVIYTSGGTPKGVEIEHRALVNYVRWATREAGIDAGTRMPLIPSISFDGAGCAIFLPLLAGGTVLPVREVSAVTVREVIEDGHATVLAITPSHLDLINQAGIRTSSMQVVITAGELLRRTTALRAREIFGPACRIVNQWGLTETTIGNTSHEFDPATDTDPGVPIGRPADNNTVRLLDPYGRPVAPGEPGEAYVGGVQVARGYLGRPDLTRPRFVRLADGTRAYRTGDIARLLPGGELAFISRTDDQVKVAGHRVASVAGKV